MEERKRVVQIESPGSNTGKPDRSRLEHETPVLIGNNFQLSSIRFLCCEKRAKPSVVLCCNPVRESFIYGPAM